MISLVLLVLILPDGDLRVTSVAFFIGVFNLSRWESEKLTFTL